MAFKKTFHLIIYVLCFTISTAYAGFISETLGNNMNEKITLILTPLTYYTQTDEDLMFKWLDTIESVEGRKGILQELHVSLHPEGPTNEDLLDLVALCDRYNYDASPLECYMHEDNRYWWDGKKLHVIYPQNKSQKAKADSNPDTIALECTPIDLYTQKDKSVMFEWMERIEAVQDIVGLGPALYLYVDPKKVTNQDLLELMGLFDRYGFDAAQLEVFKNETNKEWFED